MSIQKSGAKWKTYASLKADLVVKELFPTNSACANQAMTVVTNAEVCGVTVWTDSYLRATKRCCKYFCVTINCDGTPCRYFIEVSRLIICLHCNQMYLAGQKFHSQPQNLAGINIVTLPRASKKNLTSG